jgi:hypothetical protein
VDNAVDNGPADARCRAAAAHDRSDGSETVRRDASGEDRSDSSEAMPRPRLDSEGDLEEPVRAVGIVKRAQRVERACQAGSAG